jgi:hypothetical protein
MASPPETADSVPWFAQAGSRIVPQSLEGLEPFHGVPIATLDAHVRMMEAFVDLAAHQNCEHEVGAPSPHYLVSTLWAAWRTNATPSE